MPVMKGTRLLCGILIGSASDWVFADPNDPDVNLQELVSSAAASYENLQTQTGLVIVNQPGIPFNSVSGYSSEEIELRRKQTKSKMLVALQAGNNIAMYSYVSERFPDFPLSEYIIGTDQAAKCNVDPCPYAIVEPKSAEIAYKSMYEFTSKVANLSTYRVTFKVNSTPTGGRFSIVPLGGGEPVVIATDGQVPKIYRGLYRYTASRTGFKTITSTLNLVDSSPSQLLCIMVAASSSDEPIPCLSGVTQ